MDEKTIARFWAKVDKRQPDECWPWLGTIRCRGYGGFRWNGRTRGAHQAAWMIANNAASIPADMFVMHTCDWPSCVNPTHLSLGTPRENSQDRDRKGRQAKHVGQKGSRNVSAKLSETAVAGIRENPSQLTGRALAIKHGVSFAAISLIRSGKRWSHV